MYIEPSSDKKGMAAELRQIFNAYSEAGFSEDQSFELLLKTLSVSSAGSR